MDFNFDFICAQLWRIHFPEWLVADQIEGPPTFKQNQKSDDMVTAC